mgnify:CR=1 FL=1
MALVSNNDKLFACEEIKGINIKINKLTANTNIVKVVMTAHKLLNLHLFLKNSTIGFKIRVRIKATIK